MLHRRDEQCRDWLCSKCVVQASVWRVLLAPGPRLLVPLPWYRSSGWTFMLCISSDGRLTEESEIMGLVWWDESSLALSGACAPAGAGHPPELLLCFGVGAEGQQKFYKGQKMRPGSAAAEIRSTKAGIQTFFPGLMESSQEVDGDV